MRGRGLRKRIVWATSLQLLLVSGAVGGLAYFSGQRGGFGLAEAYRQQDAITGLSEQLSGRLAAPQLINSLNVLAIQQGQLSLNDFDSMGQRFWSQMQLFPVGYINYGSVRGEFLGVERLDSGAFVINEDAFASPLGKGTMGVYAMGAKGQRGALLASIPGMTDSHEEAWYVETVKAGQATWSSIYQWEDKPEVLAIAFNQPLYGPGRQLLGVIGVDFVLSQLNTWLAEVWKDRNGFALIVERNGMVVASSRPGLTSTGTGSKTKRVRLEQLPDPLVQATLRRLQEVGGLAAPSSLASTQTVQYRGNTYLVGLHSWGQAEKLDWLLITALRSDQIVQASQRYALIALLLSLGAVATAVLVTIRVSDWLLAPLELLRRRCQSASEQVGQGDANLVFEAGLPKGSAREIEAVSQAFGALVERLSQARRQIAEAIERERLKDAQTVLVLEDKLKSSLQAAAVAHEINLPLSSLLLNSKLLLEQQEAPLPTDLNEHLQAIASNADEVVTTIEKMRTLLRNVQTHQRRLNLANVARSALLYAGPSLKAAGITVQREGLETSLAVLGDAAQIQIAVVNLLRNALEALETAGPSAATPATIAVRLKSEGDTVVLSVADNGPGFQAPQTALAPLETSKANGSGLGLFVVQTTMENHRGSLAIGRSTLGGAEVRLIFPAAPALPITQ
ncbi:MAG: C4-dicarboxylate-specific signal transduction histidine kinase [Cyanobium sp.]|jgi:C4-dicarboxylate-specific signal transduction histidine kinase